LVEKLEKFKSDSTFKDKQGTSIFQSIKAQTPENINQLSITSVALKDNQVQLL